MRLSRLGDDLTHTHLGDQMAKPFGRQVYHTLHFQPRSAAVRKSLNAGPVAAVPTKPAPSNADFAMIDTRHPDARLRVTALPAQ